METPPTKKSVGFLLRRSTKYRMDKNYKTKLAPPYKTKGKPKEVPAKTAEQRLKEILRALPR